MTLKRVGRVLFIGVFSLPWTTSHAQSATSEPAAVIAAQGAVCRPEFTVDHKSYRAGTAFVVATERAVLLTAQHLFSPEGGLKDAVRWQDMPQRARSASCRQVAGNGQWLAGPALAIDGAHPMSPDDDSGSVNDVAVFPLNGKLATSSLALAANAPAIGARVWLVAKMQDEGESASLLHPATVVGFQNGAMLFSYDDPNIDLKATSGAPIVDSSGRVVGLNLGGGYDPESKAVVGVADDLDVIRKALSKAKSA